MKKIIALSMCLVLTVLTFGQKNKKENVGFFNKKIGFGILLGVGKSQFNIKESSWNQTNLKDTFNSVNTESGQVITLGSEMKIRLSNSFAYKQRMILNFESTKIKFDTKKNGIQNFNLQSVVIAFPIHLMFQYNTTNKRPFIYFGTTPKFNLGMTKLIVKRTSLGILLIATTLMILDIIHNIMVYKTEKGFWDFLPGSFITLLFLAYPFLLVISLFMFIVSRIICQNLNSIFYCIFLLNIIGMIIFYTLIK